MSAPRDIKQFRTALYAALEEDGFIPRRHLSKAPRAWSLPGDEVLPTFFPHEIRRPWGFNLSGCIGIEVPELRAWLRERGTRNNDGIFTNWFVGWHIANDKLLQDFQVTFDEAPPFEDWVAKLKHRLSEVPTTLHELLKTYRTARDHLGGLADPMNKPAWDFLVEWQGNRDLNRPVPDSLF